jgi:hypothetical protein
VQSVGRAVTASVKACIARLGWRFAFSVSKPKPAQDPGYIDPYTGNVCHNAGFVDVCTPPDHPVYYYNEEGRPCRRDGLVSICT